jgi:hypothetical protein
VNTLVYVPNTTFQVLVATTYGGTIYSNDGGITWLSLSSDNFNGLSFASPTSGWAGGIKGRIAKFNGKLITAVFEQTFEQSNSFGLLQNYPNPFNPSTAISYQLSANNDVNLSIFNMNGQLVRTLVQGRQAAGGYQVEWDGLDDSGLPVSSGVYLCRLQTGERVFTQKLTLFH